jgi:phenylacetate-CoA ligase
MAALLAEEQLAGRLRVAPRIVSSSSEPLTAEMAARVEAAFGTRPYDFYATTEGLWGTPCAAREGAHLFEDLVIVENVDADDRPVAPGEPGARLLIMNLFNFVQPLIRYELPDVVALHPEPCGCGSPLRRLRSIEGRADDVVRLPGRDGADIAVHPVQFGLVTADRAVHEFQVVQRGERLRLRVVLYDDAHVVAAADRLRAALAARLAGLGVADPQIDVEPVARLERAPGGKLPMVVAERAAVAVG